MKIINPSVEILGDIDGEKILKHIEMCGRVCYKSEDKITDGSAGPFVKRLIDSGHESVLEHSSISVKFIVDRGVSHEIVRHRIASYSMESTRYCNYSGDKFGNEITVIRPPFWSKNAVQYRVWEDLCKNAETSYFRMIAAGAKPQEARAVLPTSLKTELIMTANLREWRHFIKLRTAEAAHPQMREVAVMLWDKLQKKIPVVFDDILTARRGEV